MKTKTRNLRCGLGVNIDHAATLRNARDTEYPNILELADMVLDAGASRVVVHLREDRRHIRDEDVVQLCQRHQSRLNLEIAPTEFMLNFAISHGPATVCIVPERRDEKTTERGMNLKDTAVQILLRKYIPMLKHRGIEVSCFVDPEVTQIQWAHDLHFDTVELHTGEYAQAHPQIPPQPPCIDNMDTECREFKLRLLYDSALYASSCNLQVHAGHGINLDNIKPLLTIPQFSYMHIGHSIICRAVTVGIRKAVQEMVAILATRGRV